MSESTQSEQDYDGVELVAEFAEISVAKVDHVKNNNKLPDSTSLTENNLIEFTNKNSKTTDTALSRDTSKTFSSDLTDLQDMDIFEKFNGSSTDLAQKNKDSDGSNSLGYDSTIGTNYSFNGDFSNNTNNDDFELKINKQRDFKNNPEYRKISTTIIPSSSRSVSLNSVNKLDILQKQMDELNNKQTKLEREIAYLNTLIPDTFNGSELSQSMEFKKLSYAKGKLNDRLKSCNKERYELGIKISAVTRSIYGDEGADKAAFWVRKVSK